MGKNCCRKSDGKNTKMNIQFFVWNILFYLFSTQNNHQLEFLVHQSGDNAKSKWSLFLRNDATWKSMFCLFFPNRTSFFSFSFVDINVLEYSWYVPSLVKKFFRKCVFWVRVHRDPSLLTTNGSAQYLDHLSVKISIVSTGFKPVPKNSKKKFTSL